MTFYNSYEKRIEILRKNLENVCLIIIFNSYGVFFFILYKGNAFKTRSVKNIS